MNLIFKSAIIPAILILSSCKPFDPLLLNAEGAPFDPKLPAMETVVQNNLVVIVNQSGQAIGANPQDVVTVFDREVSEIMTDPYSNKRGIISLKVTNIENRVGGVGYALIGGFTAGAAFLFGVPVYKNISTIEVQIDVLNTNRKLIGSYRGMGKKVITSGLYRKENYREAARVAYLFAVKAAIQEAKGKLKPDIPRLITALDNQ